MKQEYAEKLARKLKAMFANDMRPEEHDMDALCDHILSGDMRREIENAAFDLAAKTAEEHFADPAWNSHLRNAASDVAHAIRSLIQPAAQKEEGK